MTSAPTIFSSPTRGARPQQTTSQLNVRLAVISAVVLILSAIAIFFLHRFQVQRLAGGLIGMAADKEAEEQWVEAAIYLHRYLRLQPEDAEIKVRLAQTFDRAVQEQPRQLSYEAVSHFVNAVDAAPDQTELRERLVELLLYVQRYTEAKDAARDLEEKDPGNAVAARVQLMAEFREAPLTTQTEIGEFAERFQTTLAAHPEDVELARELAIIYRDMLTTPAEAERGRLADEVIDQMVAAAPERSQSYVERFFYRSKHKLEGQGADVERALELAPEDQDVLQIAGAFALEKGQQATGEEGAEERARLAAEALAHYQKMVELFPTSAHGYRGMGNAYVLAEQNDEAIKAWRRGLDEASPNDIYLNLRLARLLDTLGRPEEAKRYFGRLKTVYNQLIRVLNPKQRASLQQVIDLPYARFLLRQGDYRQPIPLLQDLLVHSSQSYLTDEEQYEGWAMLGTCYQKTNQLELAAQAFHRMNAFLPATEEGSKQAPARLVEGRALKLAREYDRAVKVLDEARKLRPDDPEIWFEEAEALLLRERSLPSHQQNFERIQLFLSTAPDSVKGQPRYVLQQIDFVLAQGTDASRQVAVGLLRRAEREFPDEINFLYRIALTNQRLGRHQDALRVEQRVRELDDSGLIAQRLRVDLSSIGGNVSEVEKNMKELIEQAEGDERIRLKRSLSGHYLGAKKKQEAIVLLEQIADEVSDDTQSRLALAELAIHAEEWDTAEKWEQQLKDIERGSGVMWKQIRSTRLLYQAADANDPMLDEASELQAQVQLHRPEWAPCHLLAAQIAEKRGDVSLAIERYERSIELGLDQVSILQQLLGLYQKAENQQGVESTQRRLAVHVDEFKAGLVTKLTRMMASDDADELAQADSLRAQIEKQWPNDVNLRLRIAKALEENDLQAQAELWYIAARDLQRTELRVWDELFSFYGRVSDYPSAVRVLEEVAAEEGIPLADRRFMVGRAYESLGQVDEAARFFLAYLSSDQKNVARQMDVARFFAARQPETAEKILNIIVKRDPANGEARRQLATVLATAETPDWERIRRLLDSVSGKHDETLRNKRHHVELLLQDGQPERRATAVQILSSLISGTSNLDGQDVLLLAKMYEEDGNWPKANEVYEKLTSAENAQIAHLAEHTEALLRNQEWEAASRQIKRIDKQSAGSLKALELRVTALKLRKRPDQIAAVVDAFRNKQFGQLDFLSSQSEEEVRGRIGNMLLDADLPQLAETWYREAMELNPLNYQKLALSLAYQGKWQETIDLYEEKAAERSLRDATLQLVYGLQSFSLEPDVYQRAHALVTRALRQAPNDNQLLKACANFQASQGKRELAEQNYRRALSASENDIFVLNNLAYLIYGHSDRQSEALQLIDKAIQLAGTQPVLLDTKAVILLDNDPDQALRLLERAVRLKAASQEIKATTLMHLAAAYWKTGQNEKAAAALKKAQESGLDEDRLEEPDRKLLEELNERAAGVSRRTQPISEERGLVSR